MRNTQVIFKTRPEGQPSEDNFEIVNTELPPVGEGQMLRRTLWLSVDPYMRGRMSMMKSYAAPAKLGEPMVGQTVSEVVESSHPKFAKGDIVLGFDGWQSHAVGDAKELRKLDPKQAPVSWSLGVLGMPAFTAYVALLDIGQPESGETVVISGAAGAVGTIAGQIAKLKGCLAVGVAGSDEKCRYVAEELGFDACINYKTDNLNDAMKVACPDGIDVFFDNVGGPVLEAALRRMNVFGRIPLVGFISQYNDTKPAPGPNLGSVLANRLTLRGMIILDHIQRMPAFLADMSTWLREGKIKHREDIVEGLENAPRAFLGLFKGENIGKRIVKVSV